MTARSTLDNRKPWGSTGSINRNNIRNIYINLTSNEPAMKTLKFKTTSTSLVSKDEPPIRKPLLPGWSRISCCMGFGTRLAGFHSSTIGRLGALCTCHWYQWRMGSLKAFLGKVDFACFFGCWKWFLHVFVGICGCCFWCWWCKIHILVGVGLAPTIFFQRLFFFLKDSNLLVFGILRCVLGLVEVRV